MDLRRTGILDVPLSSIGYTNPYEAEHGETPPVHSRVPARAGILGNPSDGYFGKTIATTVNRFGAEARLTLSDRLEISLDGNLVYAAEDVGALRRETMKSGYTGDARILQATIALFCERCRLKSIDVRQSRFCLGVSSDIPRGVGLAGSSALVIATLNVLLRYHGVHVGPEAIPDLALDVEVQELGGAAGLQDRVIQVFGGCVYMDFHRELMQFRGYGNYQGIPSQKLPRFFVAYRDDLAEDSSQPHSELRERWQSGDKAVRATMSEIATLAASGFELIQDGRGSEIGPLMDRNFELRCQLYDVGDGNREFVADARACGAHAKLAGSGGAIVGTAREGHDLIDIAAELSKTSDVTLLEPPDSPAS